MTPDIKKLVEKVAIKETAVGAVLRLEAGDPPLPAADPPLPAADPSPLCKWIDDGNPRKRLRNSCGLQGANKSWAGMHWQCTACLKPIKFTEPSHG